MNIIKIRIKRAMKSLSFIRYTINISDTVNNFEKLNPLHGGQLAGGGAQTPTFAQ